MKKTILTLILSIAFFLNAQAQLSGTINVGEDQTYETLRDAFNALMVDGINGDVTFLITSDLTEAQNVFLGFDARPHTVTIRPAAGETPTITFTSTTGNSSINGAFVLGATSDNWDNLVTTANIVIDGSNNGTDSRDLTFTTASGAATSNFFRLVGSLVDVTWKNTNVSVQQQSFDTILISPLRRNDTDFVANNLRIENNEVISQPVRTSSRAISQWGVSGTGFETVETEPEVHIINNDIQARRYGIWLRTMTGNTTIHGNRIQMNEGAALSMNAILIEEVLSDDVVITISSNEITQLRGGGEVRGMNIFAQGTVNIINNTITGFESNRDEGSLEFYGVHIQTPAASQTVFVNAVHNTIYMNPLNEVGVSAWRYRGFQNNSSGSITLDLRNNIIINATAEDSPVTSYAFFQFGTASIVTSNNNNFFVVNPGFSPVSNFLGRLSGTGGTNILTLAGWRTNTGLDANSVSKSVTFVDAGAGNLRLSGDSDGDADLAGAPLAGVTTDIDGTPRDAFRPYMGAFEGSKLSPFVTVTGDAGWRMMSAPVSGMDVAFLATQTAIQGVDGADFGSGFPANIYSSYDGTDWISPVNTSASLSSGTGFILYFYDNNEAGSAPLPVSVAANGSSIPDSDVTVNVHSDGNGYNLLGNPFNNSLDLTQITANGTVAAVAQIWVDGVGTNGEGSWVTSSSAPFNNIIAPWQGFVLQNTDATTVTFPTSAISLDDATFQNVNDVPERYLSFELIGTDVNDGYTVTDRAAALIMNEYATSGWDRFDLLKLGSLAERSSLIYFVGENEQGFVPKALESRPFELDETLEIPLGFVSYGVSGDFELRWPEMRNFPHYLTVTLTDLETGTVVDLNQNQSYTFSYIEQAKGELISAQFRVPELTSSYEHRFILTIANQTTTVGSPSDLPAEVFLDQNYPNPFNPTTTIRFELPQQQQVSLRVYDILGREVAQLVNEVRSAGMHTITFDASRLSSGVYLYRLEAGNTSFTRRMMLVK